jgi:hypothetical protein
LIWIKASLPENEQKVPVDTTARIRQGRAMLGETENRFSSTCAASSEGRRVKSDFLSYHSMGVVLRLWQKYGESLKAESPSRERATGRQS